MDKEICADGQQKPVQLISKAVAGISLYLDLKNVK
jgi:hypothetical protein